MDSNVPAGAALLLDFIGGIEAPRGYDTIYGNNQGKLAKPITSMTLAEVIAAGPAWTKAYKSSAAGRYQFMNATLKGLKAELGLTGKETFSANLQDRLGLHLLKRRGYDDFMAGRIDTPEFGKRLAQEWASLPVLASTQGASRNLVRGQSYYAGDALNKSLVTAARVELILAQVAATAGKATPPIIEPAAAPAKARLSPVPFLIIGFIVLAVVLAAVFLR